MDQFQLEEETGSYFSCSTMANGLMMIFGGTNNVDYDKQISVVDSCGLKRVGTLPMYFNMGACNTFKNIDGEDETLLCFDYTYSQDCHR